MKHCISLSEYMPSEIDAIFEIADELIQGEYTDVLKGKTIVMFFPATSIRTRVTFERGIFLLGGQTILFEPSVLDKKEKIEDVVSYLNNWADGVVVRHPDIKALEEMAKYASFPIINAMTDSNHPCEMLGDLYALSKMRKDFKEDKYLFVGECGNIGLAWKEAAVCLGLDLVQSCPKGYEIEGLEHVESLEEAIKGKDIVCTDALPKEALEVFKGHQLSRGMMERANKGAVLNPCPPFYRGEEVTEEVIASQYFVGYHFKKHLLEIQQAVIIYSLVKHQESR
ncbi:MAG: ornithine carbamoyltransferase [Cellulosilyticaceae bacterium]